jgi:plastocyanin
MTSTPSRRPLMRKLALVVVLLLSFGCADDGDVTVPEGPDATTEASEEPEESHVPTTETFTGMEFTVEMELDDYYFEPTTIKSPGGSTATIELTNEGSVAHTFTVDALDVDEQVDAGGTKTVTVEIGTETRYEYYCRFHAESNDMKGAFSPH